MTSPYSMAFACFDCRKSFKRPCNVRAGVPDVLPCPECGGPSHNFGRHFKPPARRDQRQWEKVRFLFDHGFRFQKIRPGSGDRDTVPYPATLEDAREFVLVYAKYALPNSPGAVVSSKSRKRRASA